MSQPSSISNSSSPQPSWGPSDEIDAIIAACNKHNPPLGCSKKCRQFPEDVSVNARKIGTITHIGTGAYARVYQWTPFDSKIRECAIRSLIKVDTQCAKAARARVAAAQEKLKGSVFALPVYHEQGSISFMPLLKVENHFPNAVSHIVPNFYEFSDFLQDMLHALLDLKRRDLIHGDLSDTNCSWNRQACSRFSHFDYDFTVSSAEVKQLTVLGQSWYRPPEVWNLDSQNYGYGIDMWNAGCLAYCALKNLVLFPFQGDGTGKKKAIDAHAYYLKRKNIVSSIKESVAAKRDLSPVIAARKASELSDLMLRMLKLDPKERITPEEALQHPFFQAPENMEEFAESFPPGITALIKDFLQDPKT